MPMRKGEWHKINGKLRRIRKHNPRAIPGVGRAVGHAVRRVRKATLETGPELFPRTLNRIADSLWGLLPIKTKLMLLSNLLKQ